VRVLVRDHRQRELLPADVELFVGDIRNAGEVHRAAVGCRAVFHACCTHVYNLPARDVWAVNVEGTRHVCDAVARANCERLVFTSTISTFTSTSRPVEAAALPALPARKRNTVTKQAAEQLVLARVQNGLPAVVVNPSFFIGPFDYRPSPFRLWVPYDVIGRVRFVPAGGFNVLGAGDVAAEHFWAMENGQPGERYPAVGTNISLHDFVSIVNRATGRLHSPREIPPALLKLLARGRVFDAYVAEMLSRLNVVDVAPRAPASLQPLEQVIETTVRWFAKHSPLTRSWALMRYVWDNYA